MGTWSTMVNGQRIGVFEWSLTDLPIECSCGCRRQITPEHRWSTAKGWQDAYTSYGGTVELDYDHELVKCTLHPTPVTAAEVYQSLVAHPELAQGVLALLLERRLETAQIRELLGQIHSLSMDLSVVGYQGLLDLLSDVTVRTERAIELLDNLRLAARGPDHPSSA